MDDFKKIDELDLDCQGQIHLPFLAHLWGAYAIPLVLSVVNRPSSVSTITTRNNSAIKSIFSANVYHVPGLCLLGFGGTPYKSHKIMARKPYFHIFSLAGSQAYRILVAVRFLPSFIHSFLHLLVFALKAYSSQDFRVIIIFLVSFDALLNLTPPLEARLALYCLIFLILIFKH